MSVGLRARGRQLLNVSQPELGHFLGFSGALAKEFLLSPPHRRNAMRLQDLRNRGAADAMLEILDRPANPCVANTPTFW